MKLYRVVCFLFLLLLCSGVYGESRSLLKGKEKLKQGKWRVALSKFKSVYHNKKSSDKERGEAVVLMGRCYRMLGDFEDGLKLLLSYKGSNDAGYYLEVGELNYCMKKYGKCLNTINNYDDFLPELYYEAMWLRARSHFQLGHYSSTISDCETLLKKIPGVLVGGGDSSGAVGKPSKRLMALIPAIKELLKRAKELRDRTLYGDDYYWYRRGREEEFSGDYNKAIMCYKKIKRGVLKEAALAYIGKCLELNGSIKKALKHDKAFIKNYPSSLYSGEVLYRYAILNYLYGKRSSKSTYHALKQLMGWYKELKVGISGHRIVLAGINDALKHDIIDKKRTDYTGADNYGNLIRSRIYPETIINPLTAPWYLPELLIRAKLLYGFMLVDAGDYVKGLKQFESGSKGGLKRKILLNVESRGYLLEGVINHGYYLPKGCFGKLSQKYRRFFMLGYFYIATEQSGEGVKLFKSLSKCDGISFKERNLANLGVALLSSDKEKFKRLKSLATNSRLKKSIIGVTARYFYGCLLAGRPKKYKHVVKLFSELGKRKDRIGSRSLLALSVCALNQKKYDDAEQFAKQLKMRFSSTPYADAGDTIIHWIKHKNKGMKKRKRGKVLFKNKTLVIPGNATFNYPLEQCKGGDIVRYCLHAVSSDPCSVVTGLTIGFSIEEPQPKPSSVNEIVFFRSPLLSMREVEYDFETLFKELKEKK